MTPVQVHADHLCCPEAHLGTWPMPPAGCIVVPPFFKPWQVAKLLSGRLSRSERVKSRTTCSSGSDETEDEKSCSGKPRKVKKYVKRRAKGPTRSAVTSDDEEEQPPQQRRQRRRKAALGHVAISGDIDISSERTPFFKQPEEETVSISADLTDSSSANEEASTHNCGTVAAVSGDIDISSEWTPFFDQSEEETGSISADLTASTSSADLTDSSSANEEASTHSCGAEAALSGEIYISSEWTTFFIQSEEETGCINADLTDSTISANEEEAMPRCGAEVAVSGGVNISSEWKPFYESAEKTKLGNVVDRRVGNLGGEGAGSMKGGAGETYEELLEDAIERSGQHLKLDHPTPGTGNCCSIAMVQQCQRTPVKLFLQSRGVTINTFMQLKEEVAKFIQTNANTQKVRNMREIFNLSQMNMHKEGIRGRTWKEYWTDMQRNAEDMYGERWWECWADDTWLQATAWYLDMNIVIIWAGDSTDGRVMSTTDGMWSPLAEDEVRPQLYLGYIVRAHYQSLLPFVEELIPQFVAQPAVDKTLQDVLHALEAAKAKLGTQVNFSKIRVHIKPVGICNIK